MFLPVRVGKKKRGARGRAGARSSKSGQPRKILILPLSLIFSFFPKAHMSCMA